MEVAINLEQVSDNKPITDDIVSQGKAIMQRIQDKIDKGNLKESVKASLLDEKEAIQSVLDDIFVKNGIINQSQIDKVGGIFDSAKKRLLEIQAKDTNNRILMWGGLTALAIVGYIWYNKNKNN
jgi:LPXTG-motif cell wall-anchored protein